MHMFFFHISPKEWYISTSNERNNMIIDLFSRPDRFINEIMFSINYFHYIKGTIHNLYLKNLKWHHKWMFNEELV